MNNPLSNTVTDSRDLLEYRDFLANEVVSEWNEIVENNEMSDLTADDVNEIIGTDGYEFADNAKECFEELESSDTYKEYITIDKACEEGSEYSDFQYGESLIHENYFTEYCEDLLKDVGYLPSDLPSWIVIDFEATASNMMRDYGSITIEDETYYIRG